MTIHGAKVSSAFVMHIVPDIDGPADEVIDDPYDLSAEDHRHCCLMIKPADISAPVTVQTQIESLMRFVPFSPAPPLHT